MSSKHVQILICPDRLFPRAKSSPQLSNRANSNSTAETQAHREHAHQHGTKAPAADAELQQSCNRAATFGATCRALRALRTSSPADFTSACCSLRPSSPDLMHLRYMYSNSERSTDSVGAMQIDMVMPETFADHASIFASLQQSTGEDCASSTASKTPKHIT